MVCCVLATPQPKINEDPKDAMLREFQDEIARLKAALEVSYSTMTRARGRGALRRLYVGCWSAATTVFVSAVAPLQTVY